jgi:hypothetical protein
MATVMGGVGYGIYFTAKVGPAFVAKDQELIMCSDT